jgi:hypothetical protein
MSIKLIKSGQVDYEEKEGQIGMAAKPVIKRVRRFQE